MKTTLLLATVLLSSSLMANTNLDSIERVGSIVTVEESSSHKGIVPSGSSGGANGGFAAGGTGSGDIPVPKPDGNPGPIPTPTPTPEPTPSTDPSDKVGKIVAAAKDMVALGEAIYELVKKGKPTNVTEYAPISVVPRDPMTKEYVDPFDLEGFSFPVEKNYVTTVKGTSGKELCVFRYKVVYSFGGSYNGAGKYLTNVIIIPGSVKTTFGWDFNATMRLSGVMNHGTKAQPVAGIMVTVKYQMNSWSTAFERNDTIHLTGRGELKTMVSK